MPWSLTNPPSVAQNWTEEEQRKCVDAANAVIKDSRWTSANEEEKKDIERDAIFACIHAAGKGKEKDMKELNADEIIELAEQHPDLDDWELIERASKITGKPELSKFYTIKGTDGKDYWASLSSGSFQDREKEIISNKAIDYGVEHGDKTGQRGELRIYHYPNSRVGECTFQMRVGNFLVEAGTWDETPRAQKAKEWVGENDTGVSEGFFYNPKKFKNKVYEDEVIFFERSILKKEHASFPWSSIENITRRIKEMSHKKDLIEMIGEEEAKAILDGAEEQTKALEAMGVAFKEAEEKEVEEKALGKDLVAELEKLSTNDLKTLFGKVSALLRAKGEKVKEVVEEGEKAKKDEEEEEYPKPEKKANPALTALVKKLEGLVKKIEDADLKKAFQDVLGEISGYGYAYPKPKEKEVEEFQLNEAAIKAIAEAVKGSLPDVSALEAEIKSLKKANESYAMRVAEEVDTKVKEVVSNLPKATIYRATKVMQEEKPEEAKVQYTNPLDKSLEEGIKEIEQARKAGR